MMIIKRVTGGGIKVTEAANGRGSPYVESSRGIPVTFVPSGGIPLVAGVGAWVRFGGAAMRVGGMTLRVQSKALVVEPANG